MQIFIDFDDVIFSTRDFKHDFFMLFAKEGISQKEFNSTYYSEIFFETGERIKTYDCKEQIRRLEKIKKRQLKSLELNVENFLKNSKNYVFDDVQEFLKSFDKKELVLLSYGKQLFQKKKILLSGVEKHFAKVVITSRKKSDMLKTLAKGEKVIFIDDRPDQLLDVQDKMKKVILIRIKRKEGRYCKFKTPRGVRNVASTLLGAKTMIEKERKKRK